ncbi:multicopper oxidase domain-containing protein [Clostridiaceae bacterium 35-E11]
MGWKDTVNVNPGEIIKIIAQFGPYTGKYPWHCHILKHEYNGMMRPYEVVYSLVKGRHGSLCSPYVWLL